MTEALLIAAIFGKPVGDLETESNGLGVHAMSAADLRRVLKFVRALFQHLSETLEPRFDQARSLAHLQRLRRIHYVVRRQAVMQPARRFGIADRFAHSQRKAMTSCRTRASISSTRAAST